MKPFELIYALGDVDEAMIADAAPVARKSVLTAPVWRWTAAAACVLLAAGVTWKLLPKDNGGVVPNQSTTATTQTNSTIVSTDTTTSATQSTTESTTQSTMQTTTGTTDWEGQGGGYGGNHVYVNGEKHLGENLFNYYIYKEFTEDDTKELYAEIAAETNGTHYAYTGASLQRYILALNIPREKIEEINESSKKMYAGHKQYDRLVFTDEEINDMYTLTREEYNKKYKAPTAAIIGSVLYPFNWFVENPVEVWMQHPFALEQIEEVFENGKKANFPEKYLDEFEKKLNDYIAAVEANA
ncbi:MAG: hypothetical protein E7534_02680 [Ruminococcaceae bacterium]|nr:hypothetical protein [Oscillospiraceae bacterium]